MIETNQLKKIGDILNCEGSILGLHLSRVNPSQYFLSSHLSNGKGTVYYSTTKERLSKYLNNTMKLKELYQESATPIVTQEWRKETGKYAKEDFLDIIQCGEQYYSELSEGFKNPDIDKLLGSI